MTRDILPFPLYSFWGRLLIFIVATAWVFFFLLCLHKVIKSRRHLVSRATPFLPTSETRGYRHRRGENSFHSEEKGLDSDVVCSLPLVMFGGEVKRGGVGGSECCSICLAEFGDGEWQKLLPSCHHAFHAHCIDAWFSSHSDCPLCRKRVVVCGSASSVSMETLPREDFCRRPPFDYHTLEPGRA